MRTVYATQFDILPAEGQSPVGCMLAAKDVVADWVVGRLQRNWRVAIPRPEFAFGRSTSLEPAPGHRITTRIDDAPTSEVASLEWAHPHSGDTAISTGLGFRSRPPQANTSCTCRAD